ncbi:MAG: flagellin [Pseudomonadota bacterium]
MDSGLPDLLSNSRLTRVVTDVKNRLNVASTETVTGVYQDITKAVNGDVGSVHLLQKSLDDSKDYVRNLTLAEARADRTQAVLGTLGSEASRIGASVLSSIGLEDQTALRTLSDDAYSTLVGMFSSLSSSLGGRSLFGGDETNRPPLEDVSQVLNDVGAIVIAGPDEATIEAALDTYFNDPAGGFATTVYRGGENDAPGVEISPGIRVNPYVKADAQPIKDMIRSFAVLANAQSISTTSDADREAVLENAAKGAVNAELQVIELRATLGVSQSRIAASKSEYEAEELVLSNLLSSKISRDPYEAAAELQALETQLESAYLVTARVGRLSLANYL